LKPKELTIQRALRSPKAAVFCDNIRKFISFLLSANAGEILIVFVGVLIGAAVFPEILRMAAKS
jgi:hypothetical protein